MSIQTRKLKNGRTAYDVKLRTPDGRQYSQSFRTRKEAEAFQTKQRATRMEGVWVDPTAGRITFGSYAERWLTRARRSASEEPRALRLHPPPPSAIHVRRGSTQRHHCGTGPSLARRVAREAVDRPVDGGQGIPAVADDHGHRGRR